MKFHEDSIQYDIVERYEPCSEEFLGPNSLKRYDSEEKRTSKLKLICGICGRKFRYKSILEVHMSYHTGERLHECRTCERRFHSSSNLKIHERSHTGAKPHECTSCKKCFYTVEHLKRHERSHTREGSHQCPSCGKNFQTPAAMKAHEHTHAGEKPYQCTVCGKRFGSMRAIQRHERTHERRKFHPDTSREGVLIQSRDEAARKPTRTRKRAYECTTCGEPFDTCLELSLHGCRGIRQNFTQLTAWQESSIQPGDSEACENSYTREQCYLCASCGTILTGSDSLKYHEDACT